MKDRFNGIGQVLRFITPLLVSIGLWVLQDMRAEQARTQSSLAVMELKIDKLSNDYFRQLMDIKERLGGIEGRMGVAKK